MNDKDPSTPWVVKPYKWSKQKEPGPGRKNRGTCNPTGNSQRALPDGTALKKSSTLEPMQKNSWQKAFRPLFAPNIWDLHLPKRIRTIVPGRRVLKWPSTKSNFEWREPLMKVTSYTCGIWEETGLLTGSDFLWSRLRRPRNCCSGAFEGTADYADCKRWMCTSAWIIRKHQDNIRNAISWKVRKQINDIFCCKSVIVQRHLLSTLNFSTSHC